MRWRLPDLTALLTAALFLAGAAPLWGAASPCRAGDTSLACRLHGVLELLSATALILGVLLVLALSAAIWYYRRNRNKDLLPH